MLATKRLKFVEKVGVMYICSICSLDTLWIIDLASSEIKEIIEGLAFIWLPFMLQVNYVLHISYQIYTGLPRILEICGQQILEKLSPLKDMPHDWSQEQANITSSPEGLPYTGLMSSMTTLPNHPIICDTGSNFSGLFSFCFFTYVVCACCILFPIIIIIIIFYYYYIYIFLSV